MLNVWVTDNGGNTGIQLGFVADALQTADGLARLRTPLLFPQCFK